MNYAPILIFVYDRLNHTQNLFQSLMANEEAKDSPIFIYSDGAKDEKAQEKVNLVREFLKTIKANHLVIIERDENLGLAKNIISGVTEQVNKYGKVIVLEDDLVVAPYFLKFMNEALECYQNESKIGHIQACDFTNNHLLPNTFLIKWTGSWGWATWDRAWKLFNPNGEELLNELTSRNLTKEFDFNGKYGFTKMLKKQIEGKNNSWAIRWNASLFLKDIYSLNVGKSLVQNNGFDGSGTNCGGGNLYGSSLFLKPLKLRKISLIQENKQARRIYEQYYHQTNNFWVKALRRLKRTIKGDFKA